MGQQIRRIKEKLEFIYNMDWDKHDGDARTFLQRKQLNPVISEAVLTELETQYKVRFPEAYRRYLLEIGNGGIGPFSGIIPVNSSLEELTELAQSFGFEGYSFLSERNKFFPLQKEIQKTENWDDGLLRISDQGCSHSAELIVSGGMRGRICYKYHSIHLMPDKDFLCWYERWLDETISGVEFSSFGWMGSENKPYSWKPTELKSLVSGNDFYSAKDLLLLNKS